MLGGSPSRVPQPVDRQTAYRQQESVRRQPEDSRPTNGEPAHVPQSAPQAAPPKQKSSKNGMKPFIIALIVLVACVAGWLAWSTLRGDAAVQIDSDKHQAVFFASGQVYFGKLEVLNDDYMKLSEVFYIQSGSSDEAGDSQNPQESSENSMRLIKLGEEVHGPEDAMVINRDQVLFFENLKSDGNVSQLIENYKSGN